MQRNLLIAILLLLVRVSYAQQVRPATSARIYHEMQQLNNLVNVLYVAAHPDDENTRFLAWMANGRHVRTGYLSLTRGDGGQNILGSEQGTALGLIRTHELLEARKLDGAEQYFTRAVDFGFSKNHDETFKHWNADTITYDAVWVMRMFRPDVVICRFPPDANAGHGQHAASAIIAEKAFKAVGDEKMYPDQLKYYKAWQPKRILFNAFRFGNRNTTSEDQFKLPVGQYDPLLGMGYGELAGISRSIHRSQGAGTPSTPGVQNEYFKLVAGDDLRTSLFDGIDTTWNRVGRTDIGADIKAMITRFDFNAPAASIPSLLAIRKKIGTVKDDYWRTQKMQEIDQLILDCAGFMAEAYTNVPQAVAGDNLPFTLKLVARSPIAPVQLNAIYWPGRDSAVKLTLAPDSLFTFQRTLTIPADAPLTEPYWLSQPSSNPALFNIPKAEFIGLPETPNYLTTNLKLQIEDVIFNVHVPLSYKKLDPLRGDLVEQLRIVPPVSVGFTSSFYPQSGATVPVTVRVHANQNLGNFKLKVHNGTSAETINIPSLQQGRDTTITVSFNPQNSTRSQSQNTGSYQLNATAIVNGKEYNKTQTVIAYSHLPTLQYFSPATTNVVLQNWKSTAKRIGYIEGAGDKVPDVLRTAGLTVDMLKDADITPANLKKYDAILTGIRAANTEKQMLQWMPILLQYVSEGGTLVMQYNTLQDLSTDKLGPYTFKLSGERVTEEDAPITVLDESSRLLNYPNKITQSDFQGWVQERGLYYPVNYDEKYKTIFRMNDTGEKPLDASVLYTQYGKGYYVYTGLSFFRQLPAGNPGAIRLLMNMLSVGK
jgi:LmbE family N-acetylglucosaminyl deacetylase